jgi:Outer membrane protein beta-barrel domain
MRKLAIVFAMSCFSTMAWGQAGEFWFNYGWNFFQNNGLGTTLAFSNSSNDVSLGSGYRFSFRFNFNVKDHFGAEIGYAFNHMSLDFDQAAAAALGSPTALSYAMHMHQGTFNGVYYPLTTTDSKVRPFLTAGVQFDNFVPPGGSSYNGSTKFGANFGGGVKVHIHGIWAARFDAREYVTPKPSFGFANNSGALWQTEVSAGVGIGF